MYGHMQIVEQLYCSVRSLLDEWIYWLLDLLFHDQTKHFVLGDKLNDQDTVNEYFMQNRTVSKGGIRYRRMWSMEDGEVFLGEMFQSLLHERIDGMRNICVLSKDTMGYCACIFLITAPQ